MSHALRHARQILYVNVALRARLDTCSRDRGDARLATRVGTYARVGHQFGPSPQPDQASMSSTTSESGPLAVRPGGHGMTAVGFEPTPLRTGA